MRKMFAGAFGALLLSNVVLAGCVFDDSAIDPGRVEAHPDVVVSRADPATGLVQGVLRNNQLFSIRYWTCDHYGVQAVMIIDLSAAALPRDAE
ncbi:MAG: hypothetical protein RBS88_04975 [Spongiibacteraceae bacterium]|jgi:hypothetical protein|nr:hypothetical protein [Spongiibacteraceae bacterium]